MLVASEVPFTALPELTGDAWQRPDVLIQRAGVAIPPPREWRHHWLLPDQTTTLSLAVQGRIFWLRVPELCDFLLLPEQRRIEVSPLLELAPWTLEHLLLDQVLPRWLALGGRMVLHAALVSVGGRGVLLLGDSGAGKSTLAAFLHAAGEVVMSDDAVTLAESAAGATALATYPSIRLHPEAHAQTLGAEVQVLGPVAEYSDKVRIALLNAESTRPLPIHAVYQLAGNSEPVAGCLLRALPPSAACIALLKQAFAMDLRDPTHIAPILRFHARLAAEVPVFELSYPRRFDALPDVLAQLRHHLQGLPEPAGDHAAPAEGYTIRSLAN